MRIVADENVEGEIVQWLRSERHDVLWVTEIAPAASDPLIMQMTRDDGRVLPTVDLDFGEMVVRQGLAPAGVILLRFRTQSAARRLSYLQGHWPSIESRIDGHLLIVSDGRLRARRFEP
jgi:predicted nuclease of predicted toxin-antitoxin system